MLNKKLLLAAALVGIGTFSANVLAATATNTFSVKLTINAACTVTAGASSDIDFGTADANSVANINASNTISVTCSNSTPYNIGLTPVSTNSSDGTGTMAGQGGSNTDTVAYALFQDSNNATSWGATIGTNTLAGTGNGNAQPYSVYGLVNGNNLNVTPDDYLDTVTVTVTY